MSTMPWELRPAVREAPAGADTRVSEAVPSDVPGAPEASAAVQSARPRPVAVLASTLPALLLLGLCVAGLSDPPDAPATGSGSVSRLHVPSHDPDYLPSVPLHR